MIKKLRARFIRIAMASVAVVLLLLTAILNTANYITNDHDLTRTLALIADNQGTIPDIMPGAPPSMPSAENGETPPEKPEGDDGQQRNGPFNKETPFSTRYFLLQTSADGAVTDSELSHIAAVTDSDIGAFAAAALRHGVGDGYYSGYKFRVTATESGYSIIFVDAFQQLRSVKQVALWSLAADAFCLALVYLLVVLLSRRAIDPMVRGAERQKQFVTDASHELKTPITVIATCLSVLEMEVGKQKWIDKARGQTERLKELVNSLVTLSRMDEETSPLHMADFPVSEAVEETASSFADYADSQGHSLVLDIQPGLTYRGDEYAVRQLASLLLDNAVKYAAPGGAIRFSLEKAKRGVVIRCENPCESWETLETDKLFDRFYRADASRSGEASGFGIGLSVARSIAEGHRGWIKAEAAEGRVVFTACLR